MAGFSSGDAPGSSDPVTDVTVEFAGRTLTLRPGSKTRYATIFVQYEPDAHAAWVEAVTVMRRFLSSFSWVEGTAIKDVEIGGGGFPVFIGRPDIADAPTATVRGGQWRRDYLPEPSEPTARRALALFREARALEHVSRPYAFLGYAKILNISLADGKKQVKWMNDTIPKIRDHMALKRIEELRKTEPDLGQYLYGSGRCAVAHANADPVVDPDDVEDTIRLAQDLPVARALAERFIETELRVKTLSTTYREHLYELAGFHPIIGKEIVSKLKSGELPESPLQALNMPDLTIRIDYAAREEHEIAFVKMRARKLAAGSGVLVLYCESPDARSRLTLALDFANERLLFDPERQVEIVEDGSAETITHAITRLQFIRGMVFNGRTEVINADTGERLGRTDPCVPVNIDSSATIKNLDDGIAELESERDRRLAGPESGKESPTGRG